MFVLRSDAGGGLCVKHRLCLISNRTYQSDCKSVRIGNERNGSYRHGVAAVFVFYSFFFSKNGEKSGATQKICDADSNSRTAFIPIHYIGML